MKTNRHSVQVEPSAGQAAPAPVAGRRVTSRPARPERGREILPHTADTGLRAWAPDLPGLFEEAAAALGEIAAEFSDVADVAATTAEPAEPAERAEPADVRVAVEAPDLAGLAFAWLNELIGLADVHHAALAGTTVGRVDHASKGCALDAVARYVDRAALGVRLRHDVKSATFHGLAVRRTGRTWSMVAYLDI